MAKGQRLATIGGSPPDLARLPPGCAFAERCAWAQPACRETQPPAVTIAPGHRARCLRTDATAAAAADAAAALAAAAPHLEPAAPGGAGR